MPTPRPHIAFVVNGGPDSAMGIRARSLAAACGEAIRYAIAYREDSRLRSIGRFRRFLRDQRADVAYVLDMAYSGVLAAAGHRLRYGGRMIVDTGDAIAALARSSGMRGPVGVGLTAGLEQFGLRVADHIVVRGTHHAELLSRRGISATVIPDGVDVDEFAAGDGAAIRRELALEGRTVVGLVGSSVWSEKLGMCYGWDLVELLGLDRDVCGLIVGDGSGIERLRRRADELGVLGRLRFAGRVAYPQLPDYIAAMDICLSTQSNDVVGRVRTTGKLPLYLAAGRFVLASRVGEAARVLPEEMLVDYRGVKDPAYPARLAGRLARFRAAVERARYADSMRSLARCHFAYPVLAEKLVNCVRRVIGTTR